jgi:NDP-sugar pyrophosphorylase family protein
VIGGFRAVLQAGGRGERMGALTADTPKPMLAAGGVPMVERLVRSCAAWGIRRVTVIVGWRGEVIVEHLRALGDLAGSVELDFLREAAPRGNVGSLAEVGRGEPLLFMFADLVMDLPLDRLCGQHAGTGAAMTLATHWESLQVRLGEVVAEGDRVVGYLEKPEKRVLIGSGVAAIGPECIPAIEGMERCGISGLVEKVLARGLDVRHWVHGDFWMDVNTPDDLRVASARLAQRGGQAGTPG